MGFEKRRKKKERKSTATMLAITTPRSNSLRGSRGEKEHSISPACRRRGEGKAPERKSTTPPESIMERFPGCNNRQEFA